MSDLPDVLRLTEMGEGRFDATQPSQDPEGRDVVFSGQYIAQMLMAAEASEERGKSPRSVHALFSRVGSYTKPLEVQVEVLHTGRTWGSDTVSVYQDDRLLCRSMVLMTSQDPDLISHQPAMPADLPGPDDLESKPNALAFPNVDWRPVPGEHTVDGVPVMYAWHRFGQAVGTPAANQAILSWSTCGNIIGLAFRPHRDAVDIGQAHRTLNTGVIGHTIHFTEPFDVSQWLLLAHWADKAASGRILGRGQVFTQDGQLVAEFSQDAMAKTSEKEVDWQHAM
jgi:acyl-CoA thioesterase II